MELSFKNGIKFVSLNFLLPESEIKNQQKTGVLIFFTWFLGKIEKKKNLAFTVLLTSCPVLAHRSLWTI